MSTISANAAERKGRPARPAPSAEAPGGEQAADVTPRRVLRDAYLRFVEGKTEEAAGLCQRQLEDNDASVRAAALYLTGRSLWVSADARDRADARKAWDELARYAADDANAWAYTAIAKSLVLEGKSARDAIVTLQQAVNKDRGGMVMVELRIELARMLGNAHRIEEAKSCLEGAEKTVREQTRGYADEGAPYQAAIAKVRKGLKEEENPGFAEVEAADALLRDGEFVEAARAYGEVIERYPKAESGDRAQVGMGRALCGLNRTKEAMAGWGRFLAAKPAGRWRGQAFAAVLDMLLDGQGSDLLKTAEWADTSLALGVADKEAGASWKSIESDLHLRIGVARWVNGKGEKAAGDFERVRQLSSGDSAKALEALIPIVKANRSILPEGVVAMSGGNKARGLDGASLVLSLAVVNSLSGRQEAAQEYVSRVLGRRVGARAEQMAFAQLLAVCLDEAKGETSSEDIHKRYQTIARQYGSAPWADEVMYRLGAMQDGTAIRATDTDPMGLNSGKPAEQLTLDSKIEANVVDAYRAVMEKWPGSPRRERAMWRLGRILLDNGNGDEANRVFAQELKDYPKGAYAGDAIVRLVDVALEYRFDLAVARQLAELGTQWAQSDVAAKVIQDTACLEPWRLMGKQPNLPVNEWVKYEVFLRAGLVAYLDEDFAGAIRHFQQAKPAKPQPGAVVATKHSDLSLDVIREAAEGKYIPWDRRAIELCKSDAQSVAIRLGDLYLHCVRAEKALGIFSRFDEGDKLLIPVSGNLLSYTQERLALSYSESRADIPKAIAIYEKFYEPPLRGSMFAPEAILQLGVLKFNSTQDSANSMPHYEYFLKHFPNHQLAEKAMYFYTVGALRRKELALAEKCADEFLNKYANSPCSHWRDDVRKRLAELRRETGNKQ